MPDAALWAILFIAGVASGWINVLAGGGSILTVPVMVFLGLPGPVANGTDCVDVAGSPESWMRVREALFSDATA